VDGEKEDGKKVVATEAGGWQPWEGGLIDDAFGAEATTLAASCEEVQAWAHTEAGFDQDACRRRPLAAVLLPVAELRVPAADGGKSLR
jgi:hypothetical protein